MCVDICACLDTQDIFFPVMAVDFRHMQGLIV